MVLGPRAWAIETGTYLGDSAELLGDSFASVCSIERDSALYERACRRFEANPHIRIVQGTSREKLMEVVPPNGVPTLFWLDAHYSGGVTAGLDDPCPLLAEIEVVRSTRDPRETIVLVDDARGLLGQNGWPLMSDVVRAFGDAWTIAAIDDVLVCSSRESVERLISDPHGSARLFELEKVAGDWKLFEKVIRWVRPIQLIKRLAHARNVKVLLTPRALLQRAISRFR